MNKYTLSSSGISAFLWDVKRETWTRSESEREAENAFSALVWYVNTGRAPTAFIKSLLTFSPRVVSNSLMKGGTDEQKIERLKKAIERKNKKMEG